MNKLHIGKNDGLVYKKITADNYDAACSLCIRVFDKQVAPLNPPHGRDTFVKFVTGQPLKQTFDNGEVFFHGCFDTNISPERLVGIIAVKFIRRQPHISLLFVLDEYSGKGIGAELIRIGVGNAKSVTVNASINAEEFYKKQGFRRTAGVVFEDGLKTIPMKKTEDRKTMKLFSGVLSVILPVLIALIALYANGISPFGEKSFLIYDLKSQYIDFYNSFSRIFSGDLFYSFSRTLGGDNFTLNAYYLFSPFNLILLFFSKESMADGVLVLYLLKTTASGFSFAFVMQKTSLINRCGRVFYIMLPAVATAYALCGFAVSYSLNVFWLDALVLLPFLSLALEKAIKGKPVSYIVITTLSLMINFYFGFMLVIFSLTSFFAYSKILSSSYKTIHFRKFIKFTSIGCMLSGFVTVPVLFGLLTTKLSTSNPLYAIFSSAGSYESLSMIGILLLVVAIVITLIQVGERFLPNNKKSLEKEKKFSLHFVDPEVKKLIIPLAAAIIIFWMFIQFDLTSSLFLSLFPTNQDVNVPPLFITMTGAVFALIFVFLNRIDKEKRIALSMLSAFWLLTLLIKPLYLVLHMGQQPLSYPGRYIFIISFLLLQNAMIASGRISVHKCGDGAIRDNSPVRIAALISVALLMVFETSVNAFLVFRNNESSYYGYTDRNAYIKYVKNNDAVIEKVKESEKSFFRTEKTYNRSLNDAYTFNTSGISHYSSMYENEIINTLNLMGLSASAYWVQYKGSTPVTDMLFGIDYVLDDNILTTFYQEKYYKKQFSENGISVYKNPYSLNLAIAVQSEAENLRADTIDPFMLQNNYVKAVTGAELQPFSIVNSYEREETVFSDGSNYGKEDNGKTENITYTFELEKSGGLFMCIKYGTRPVRIFVNGEYITHYFTHDTSGSVYLGDFSSGDEVIISLEANIGMGESVVGIKEENEFFAVLDIDKLQNIVDSIKDKTKVLKAESGKINIIVENGQDLMLTLPYSPGWKAKVDGVATETFNIGSGFLGVELLNSGEHSVELVYTPPGLGRGAIITVLGVIALVLVLTKKK
ncbi:MAG: GNAT family N-acetyltransferase [Eubacteriales bacterium]|nr:GNAT family N-acetyltransferase [Eubacteriales bacterium]MDD4474882.1 GNAT family N-acetyltransferase [Eubacteriales bacterium]